MIDILYIMNIEFIDFVNTRHKPIEGEGLRRKKKKKKKIEKGLKGNVALRQLLDNMKLRKEREILEDEAEVLKKQKELFKLLNI